MPDCYNFLVLIGDVVSYLLQVPRAGAVFWTRQGDQRAQHASTWLKTEYQGLSTFLLQLGSLNTQQVSTMADNGVPEVQHVSETIRESLRAQHVFAVCGYGVPRANYTSETVTGLPRAQNASVVIANGMTRANYSSSRVTESLRTQHTSTVGENEMLSTKYASVTVTDHREN